MYYTVVVDKYGYMDSIFHSEVYLELCQAYKLYSIRSLQYRIVLIILSSAQSTCSLVGLSKSGDNKSCYSGLKEF